MNIVTEHANISQHFTQLLLSKKLLKKKKISFNFLEKIVFFLQF